MNEQDELSQAVYAIWRGNLELTDACATKCERWLASMMVRGVV